MDENTLRKLSEIIQRDIEHGRLIQNSWEEFSKNIVGPSGASPQVEEKARRLMREVFFGGAMTVVSLLSVVPDIEEKLVSYDLFEKVLGSIHEELSNYSGALFQRMRGQL